MIFEWDAGQCAFPVDWVNSTVVFPVMVVPTTRLRCPRCGRPNPYEVEDGKLRCWCCDLVVARSEYKVVPE